MIMINKRTKTIIDKVQVKDNIIFKNIIMIINRKGSIN